MELPDDRSKRDGWTFRRDAWTRERLLAGACVIGFVLAGPQVVGLITREAPGGPEDVVRQYLDAVGSGDCETYRGLVVQGERGSLAPDRHPVDSERYTIAECATPAGPFLGKHVEDIDIERAVGAGRKERQFTEVRLSADLDGERYGFRVELRVEDDEWKIVNFTGGPTPEG